MLFPIFFLIFGVLLCSANGPVIYWSKRVGKGGTLFEMPKFRTMKLDAPIVATHLLQNSGDYLTPFGKFLRKSSLDELPQIYSILRGEMSLVGPRPALYNQEDLINLRKAYNVDSLTPGLTGLAQINGRDELSIEKKTMFDVEYLKTRSFLLDFKILCRTFFKVFCLSGVTH